MEKLYLPQSVYEAAQERLDFIFSEFDNIILSFSGGKDSGLLVSLVMDYLAGHGAGNRHICLFHQDFEAQYTATTEYVTRVFEQTRGKLEQFWVCLPMGSKTNLSNYELYWYPWDPDKRDIWVREPPDDPAVITPDNNPFAFYRPKMLQEDLYKSCPTRGTWIEIALLGLVRQHEVMSCPTRGTWIEIT